MRLTIKNSFTLSVLRFSIFSRTWPFPPFQIEMLKYLLKTIIRLCLPNQPVKQCVVVSLSFSCPVRVFHHTWKWTCGRGFRPNCLTLVSKPKTDRVDLKYFAELCIYTLHINSQVEWEKVWKGCTRPVKIGFYTSSHILSFKSERYC